MRWVEDAPAMPESSTSAGGEDGWQAIGDMHFERREIELACAAYERGIDAEDFSAWARLAECRLALGRVAEAMAACEQGIRRAPNAALHYLRGMGFQAFGIKDKAASEFERAIAFGENNPAPLKARLFALAKNPDPHVLLAYCDALQPRHRTLALAYRAIALSRLGRCDEARALIDLDRHVVRTCLDLPPGFPTLAEFNRALAEEILSDPPPGPPDQPVAIHYYPRVGPALAALRVFTRRAMEAYCARLPELGLDGLLAAPDVARLVTVTTVLRGDGRNRQHVHPAGMLSAVYHVRIPESVRAANDDRGALLLGPCDERSHGHSACWGSRTIKPVEGWLTLFPAHIFHDVVPSQTGEPRISVAMDMASVREG